MFFVGFIVSVTNGVIFPVFGVFMAKMLAVLIKFESNKAQARTDANLYCLLLLLLAIASFVLNLIQQTVFSTVG